MIRVSMTNRNILKVCKIRNKQVSGQSFCRFTFWAWVWLVALFWDALFWGALVMGTFTMGGLIWMLFCGTLTGRLKYV